MTLSLVLMAWTAWMVVEDIIFKAVLCPVAGTQGGSVSASGRLTMHKKVLWQIKTADTERSVTEARWLFLNLCLLLAEFMLSSVS